MSSVLNKMICHYFMHNETILQTNNIMLEESPERRMLWNRRMNGESN